jgi:hypothetical protein
MSKKQSLAAALQTFDRTPPAQTAVTTAPARRARKAAEAVPISPQPPSRIGKKALIGYFDPGVSKQLKQMALDGDTSTQELLREALNDFFQKHKKPAIA